MAIAQESPVTIAPMARAGDPCIVVIFGAAGDLTKRKLVPALYNLLTQKLLPDRFAVMGVTSAEYSDPEFRAKLSTDIREFATTKVDDQLWNWFDERVHYVAGDFHDPNLYQKLKTSLAAVDKEQHTSGNYLFYLATAPQFFGEIIGQLGRATLTTEENGRWRRVIIEKPFGRDLDSARALNKEIKKTLDEGQIYRIDHYLGKETVQNMLVFRFGNGIFE
ncbi:MAG TPA: hypothetical protein VKB29_11690, partial [Candidatus Binataceae bacterium]|nr:hypothetical protein [Candidatus Binataceae bacterium]